MKGTSEAAIKWAEREGIPLTRKQQKAKRQRKAEPQSGRIYRSKRATRKAVWVSTDWAGSGYFDSVSMTEEEIANRPTKGGE